MNLSWYDLTNEQERQIKEILKTLHEFEGNTHEKPQERQREKSLNPKCISFLAVFEITPTKKWWFLIIYQVKIVFTSYTIDQKNIFFIPGYYEHEPVGLIIFRQNSNKLSQKMFYKVE